MLATSNKLRPVTIGNLAVVDELQHGFRPAFAEARREPDIRRFLIAPYLWRERTADEAERFGRRLIELTNARLPELQSKPSTSGRLPTVCGSRTGESENPAVEAVP